MPGKTLRLGLPEIGEMIDERYAREPDGWRKRRLLAVKLAAQGTYTSAAVAELCGVARPYLFEWLKVVRQQGLEALLAREKPGPKEGTVRGVTELIWAQLRAKLEGHELANVEQARRWLAEQHQLTKPYKTVWNWLKKLGGVLRVPRPSHSKKDPHAATQCKNEVSEKFAALALPAGTRLKVWFMDEARFGLHTEMRRVWTIRGVRPVVTRQIKYAWDYLYGALAVVSGEAHFAHIPSVSLAWDRSYLEDLVASDPTAIHVLVRDQAGFHLRDGDPRLPAQVRIVDLPPYSPELNPCEQLWDMVKDDLANQVFATVSALRKHLETTLRRFWSDAGSILRLIGRDWFLAQLNASPKPAMSY